MRPCALSTFSPALASAAAAVALALAMPAGAERADRSKPMVVEADRSGTLDLQRQVLVYDGNAIATQGTMQLRAERIEVRNTGDGHRTAVAQGTAGKPATWRQKRDGVDETVEGSADRIEFDTRTDTLRLVGAGTVRRLRAGKTADEITGAVITWDNNAELFRVEGGAATAANPGGRVRTILSPRPEGPASGAGPAAPLQPSRSLPEPR
jgi:lipopolysaccharide export system protein LptA